MPTSVMQRRAAELVNPLPVRSGTSSASDGKSLPSFDVQPILKAAIDESRVPHKVIAICMGIQPSHLSEMLAGTRPLNVNRLEMLPAAVLHLFVQQLAEAVGLHVHAEDEEAAALADLLAACGRYIRTQQFPRKVMAKASSRGAAARAIGG